MEKKTPQTITVEIPVDMIREVVMDYVHSVLTCSLKVHASVYPTDEVLQQRFEAHMRDPEFVLSIKNCLFDNIHVLDEILDGGYDDDFFLELNEKSDEAYEAEEDEEEDEEET